MATIVSDGPYVEDTVVCAQGSEWRGAPVRRGLDSVATETHRYQLTQLPYRTQAASQRDANCRGPQPQRPQNAEAQTSKARWHRDLTTKTIVLLQEETKHNRMTRALGPRTHPHSRQIPPGAPYRLTPSASPLPLLASRVYKNDSSSSSSSTANPPAPLAPATLCGSRRPAADGHGRGDVGSPDGTRS